MLCMTIINILPIFELGMHLPRWHPVYSAEKDKTNDCSDKGIAFVHVQKQSCDNHGLPVYLFAIIRRCNL